MHVKCESEGHCKNNRRTGKIPQPRITEKSHCGKKHILDDSITNITPNNSITNETTRTQIKFFHCQYADSPHNGNVKANVNENKRKKATIKRNN